MKSTRSIWILALCTCLVMLVVIPSVLALYSPPNIAHHCDGAPEEPYPLCATHCIGYYSDWCYTPTPSSTDTATVTPTPRRIPPCIGDLICDEPTGIPVVTYQPPTLSLRTQTPTMRPTVPRATNMPVVTYQPPTLSLRTAAPTLTPIQFPCDPPWKWCDTPARTPTPTPTTVAIS